MKKFLKYGDFVSYEEAKKIVQETGVKTRDQYKIVRDRELFPKLPKDPAQVYTTKFEGWGTFLGTGRASKQRKNFRTFNQAKKYAKSLKLKGRRAWAKLKDRPSDIPNKPDCIYKKDWKDWQDFLGYDNKYYTFKKAKMIIRKLKFKDSFAYRKYARTIDTKLPNYPEDVYRIEWISYGDYLHNGYIAPMRKKFVTYEQAVKFVRSLKITRTKAWQKFCTSGKRPQNIPTTPNTVYRGKGWKSYPEFFGTDIAGNNVKYMTFKKAKEFVQKLNLKNRDDFFKAKKLGIIPIEIPSQPNYVYK